MYKPPISTLTAISTGTIFILFCLGPFRLGSRLKFMQSGRAVKKPGECRFVWLRVGEKKLGRSRRPGTSVIFQSKATTKEQKWNARNSFTLTRLRTCQKTLISNSWKKSYLHWRTEVCMFRSNEAPTLETFHNCSTSIIFRFVSQHCLRITVYTYIFRLVNSVRKCNSLCYMCRVVQCDSRAGNATHV